MRFTSGRGALPRVLAGGLAFCFVVSSSRADEKDAQKKEKAEKVVEEKKVAVKKAAEKAADAVGEAVGNLIQGLFVGRAVEAQEAVAIEVMDAAAAGEGGDPFDQQVRPILKSVLHSELHFIRKVCQPTPEQFAKIRDAGREHYEKERKKFIELVKNQNRGNAEFPDPRTEISKGLIEAVSLNLSPEAVARYRVELDHRDKARRQAAIDNMVMRLDRSLALSPEQSQKLAVSMTDHFSAKWTKQMCAFLYSEEYAPLPEGKIVTPILNDAQKKIWSAMPQGYSVSFGWQGEFNFLGDQFDAFAEEVGK